MDFNDCIHSVDIDNDNIINNNVRVNLNTSIVNAYDKVVISNNIIDERKSININHNEEVDSNRDNIDNYNIIHTKLEPFNKIYTKKFILNIDFSKRLKYLEFKAIEIQYQLAYLSTLGGAYHLCNHPQTALIIANKQEKIGIQLCSSSIILRAKVFQATNYYLMGYKHESNILFKECKNMIKNKLCSDENLLVFIEASEIWLHARDNNNGNSSIINNTLAGSSSINSNSISNNNSNRGSKENNHLDKTVLLLENALIL